ncbi:L-dopachrome tautomerase-related protein [Tenacibaculum dicentrarchi]|uniref:L-dopachrome tautomerase-related protein n=1 Tax=Tenacibaculum dicentrarchi TaxID=669041 RepID=UPI000C7BA6F2|nr:conserved hypothetical protein [Tenacibaculum dicentrarchi]
MKIKLMYFVLSIIATQTMYSQSETKVEVVSELNIRPGNVAINKNDRIFMTVHPLGNPQVQLVEITGKKTYKVFPNKELQNNTGKPNQNLFDTPLGLKIDEDNVLWVIDMGLNLGKTRLWAFDIATGKEVYKYEFSKKIAPKGSFIQDLAIDKKNGWVYLADIANPGIIALNIKNKTVRRFSDITVQAENIDMVIDKKIINFGGKPARVAINPITLSFDKETLYYGAMNGTTWYKVSAKLFRDKATDKIISKAIKVVGPKPISDGVATAKNGNHYMTNLQHGGIDVLTSTGELKPVVRNAKIDWPDNVALNNNGWIYIAVNQLYKTPAFTGGVDDGKAPYYILKAFVGN